MPVRPIFYLLLSHMKELEMLICPIRFAKEDDKFFCYVWYEGKEVSLDAMEEKGYEIGTATQRYFSTTEAIPILYKHIAYFHSKSK